MSTMLSSHKEIVHILWEPAMAPDAKISISGPIRILCVLHSGSFIGLSVCVKKELGNNCAGGGGMSGSPEILKCASTCRVDETCQLRSISTRYSNIDRAGNRGGLLLVSRMVQRMKGIEMFSERHCIWKSMRLPSARTIGYEGWNRPP